MEKLKCFFIKYYVYIFFLIIFLIGLFTFKDYGIYMDEPIQRQHSLVSYYRVKSVLTGKSDKLCRPSFDKNSAIEKLVKREKVERCLNRYPYKYYGVALQLPLVAIEDIFSFKLSYQTIFHIRHLYTFIIFFLSLICLYKIIDGYIVKDKKYALLAVLLMVLSPRIYGEAFYNIKDLVFMSMSIINLYFVFRYFRNSNFKNLSLLCFVSAIVINCRVVGGIYIALTFLYNIISKRKNIKECLKSSLLMIFLTYLFYIIITPASWYDPIMFPFKTIDFFYNYIDPVSKLEIICYHLGKFYFAANLPADYIPVWIFITTPILYIVLFIIGFFIGIVSGIKKIIKKTVKKLSFELIFCNLILVSILAFVMIRRPTLYGGWRHLYFLYPIIIINCVVGIKKLLSIKYLKSLVCIIIVLNSLFVAFLMIKDHPYQYEYYEYIFRDRIIKDFSMNYYQISNIDAIKYILKHDTRKKIKVVISANKNENIIKMAKDYKRIELTYEIKDADYIISNYMYDDEKSTKAYKELYTEKIFNKYRLFTVYKR